jgi:RecA/RadA recombinase
MDIHTKLILVRNNNTGKMEDRTVEVSNLVFRNGEAAVTYKSTNKTYNYRTENVLSFVRIKDINLDHVIIYVNEFPIREYTKVIDFGEYIKIFDNHHRVVTHEKSKVRFQKSCLESKKPKAVFDFFKKLSASVSVTDDGKTVLLNQYEKMIRVSEDSVLSTFISGSPINKNNHDHVLIFPFGFNLSQREAVRKSFENSISIIEGPPGTGKTQTILNIIANVISRGETVGVVSGNNSATSNVQEKLEKTGYGFFTALLGNSNIKKEFFEHKQLNIPEMEGWVQSPEEIRVLSEKLQKINTDLTELLEDRNRMAKLQGELSKFKVEQAYYENNFKGEVLFSSKFSLFKKWTNDSILTFIVHLEKFILEGQKEKFLSKALMFFKYGIYKFKFLNDNQEDIISSFKKLYYQNSIKERERSISLIKEKLENKSYEELMKNYTDLSSKFFKAELHSNFSKRARGKYTIQNFKYNFQDFIQDYPVVLSTTHSIKTSIAENYLFDYLIIDEASQVDLVTASLALSCCKNVIIVGDVKQLPHIVPSEIEKISDEIFDANNIGEAYNYSKYSIIASLMNLYEENLPKTLLCEHYRCHPKIIGFCNEKFYDNQLVIMTEENPEDKPLRLYKTVPGNHARKDRISDEKGWYNIRQIEVVRDEIMNGNTERYQDCSHVGIISPYRKHVTETKQLIINLDLEVDTVHKFQGREKSTIIFTTVSNDINQFVDDANLINVAVSRAINELMVVTSNKLFKQHGTNIGDLIRYIEYNTPYDAIVESQKISVFDLLYSESSVRLLRVMTSSKNISKYKSENLMYGVIKEVLDRPEFHSFKCVLHIPLNSIVRDFSNLNDEESAFAKHPWTHVDFLIFNKLDKEPVLVVEVDGHEYHRNNEKQRYRDATKDKILAQIDLPILRCATNESGEKEKLIRILERIVKLSAETNSR